MSNINTCGHPDRPHYSLGKCNPCYQRALRNGDLVRRRAKKGRGNDVCEHSDRPHSALGMCQSCYVLFREKYRGLIRGEYRIAFIPDGETVAHFLEENPTPFSLDDRFPADAPILLRFIDIGDERYWVGAAHTAPLKQDGIQGRIYRLYSVV